MKVALVCDWLTNVGGAEKVLLKLHEMFPEAAHSPRSLSVLSLQDHGRVPAASFPAARHLSDPDHRTPICDREPSERA